MTVMIFSGETRYADPWHPIAETSRDVEQIVQGLGRDVTVRTDADPENLANLDGVELLIVNSGGGMPDDRPTIDDDWQAAFDAVDAYAANGGAILGVHTAANAFPEWSGWADIIGTGWARSISGHPRRSLAVFEAAPGMEGHPIFDGLPRLPEADDRPVVIAYDERYWKMLLRDSITPLIGHHSAEEWHVSGWLNGDRVIYDGMGHDGRSYESPSRRQFSANACRFLLGE